MKNPLLLLVLLSFIPSLSAQKDTLWFNKNWQKVKTKNEATYYLLKTNINYQSASTYYFPENKEIGKLLELKNTIENTDYRNGNTITFTGENIYKDEIYKKGKIRKIIYYDTNGNIMKRETYDDNKHITLTENIDKKGAVKSTLTYSLETGLPYMGQLINVTATGETITTYKFSKIVNKETVTNNDMLFNVSKKNTLKKQITKS